MTKGSFIEPSPENAARVRGRMLAEIREVGRELGTQALDTEEISRAVARLNTLAQRLREADRGEFLIEDEETFAQLVEHDIKSSEGQQLPGGDT
jgi:predicted transcriptional regulator